MPEFEMRGSALLLGDRRIGWITTTSEGKHIFKSPRKRISHYFRVFHGWALSTAVLEFLKENNFDEVHLQIGQSELLISQLTDWFSHGIPYQKQPFEPQTVLPEKYFVIHKRTLSELTP